MCAQYIYIVAYAFVSIQHCTAFRHLLQNSPHHSTLQYKLQIVNHFLSYILQCRYGDWLRDGRSGDRIRVADIFCTRPDWPWGPPSLLYSGYWMSFLGVKRPGRGVNLSTHLVPRLKREQSYISTPFLDIHGLC
jgi:hypothetical protein